MHHEWKIIEDANVFVEWVNANRGKRYALDIETYGKQPHWEESRIIGISLTSKVDEELYKSAYIPLFKYDFKKRELNKSHTEDFLRILQAFLSRHTFIGWNSAYDKSWIDRHFNVETQWEADGRIMWQMQNNDPAIRGYGLKTAQKALLKWERSNEDDLKFHIQARGGKLENGDHYMADTDVIAYYACLDTYSTYLAYDKLKYFFDKHAQWNFLKSVMDYADFLRGCTVRGILLIEEELKAAREEYRIKREAFAKQLIEDFKHVIQPLEDQWLEEDLKTYKSLKGKAAFMLDKERHRRFNPASAQQRVELLHNILKLPVVERTEQGQPKTDRAALAQLKHPAAELLLLFSEYKKLYEMAGTYLENCYNNRLHPSYDVCGTVSGRLAGFQPSVLNLPFSEEPLMAPFKCEPGYVGIHADLAAIEPCVIAHYSDDPALLKVYGEGKGDIYLDLALELFPSHQELKNSYNANEILNPRMKEVFKDLRGIAKTIHLAVSYTGTYVTVGKNLNKAGYPTTPDQARQLVFRYWKKFEKVKEFNEKLHYIYEKNDGFIRNIVGRVIQVPNIYKKDLMNRLIQSSAHDILMLWVTKIQELAKKRNLDMHPILPDVHDSTSWQVREDQKETAYRIYNDALHWVNETVKLAVPIKAEIKFFRTFAGLKGEE